MQSEKPRIRTGKLSASPAGVYVVGGGPSVRAGFVGPSDIPYFPQEYANLSSDMVDRFFGSKQSQAEDMTAPSREEIDAKLAATEARIEASVSRMEGTLNAVVARLDARMDAIDARIGTLPTSGTMWAAAGTTIISILGVVLTVLAFGGDRFSSGLEFGATFGQETAEIRQLVQQNSESIERLVNILEEQRTQPAPAQEPKE